MKVIEEKNAFLSDYEVLQYLSKLQRSHQWDDASLALQQENRKKKIKTKRPYNNPTLQSITRDAISYLSINKNYVPQEDDSEEDRLNNEKSSLCGMNDNDFTGFISSLNRFDLFKAEKLQIVNQLPTNMVHLYSIVEECDSRFTEDQIESIIDTVQQYSVKK